MADIAIAVEDHLAGSGRYLGSYVVWDLSVAWRDRDDADANPVLPRRITHTGRERPGTNDPDHGRLR